MFEERLAERAGQKAKVMTIKKLNTKACTSKV